MTFGWLLDIPVADECLYGMKLPVIQPINKFSKNIISFECFIQQSFLRMGKILCRRGRFWFSNGRDFLLVFLSVRLRCHRSILENEEKWRMLTRFQCQEQQLFPEPWRSEPTFTSTSSSLCSTHSCSVSRPAGRDNILPDNVKMAGRKLEIL